MEDNLNLPAAPNPDSEGPARPTSDRDGASSGRGDKKNEGIDRDRVFEFTPDLNISPVNPDVEIPTAPIPATDRPQSPLQDAIGRLNMSPKMREQLAGIPVKPAATGGKVINVLDMPGKPSMETILNERNKNLRAEKIETGFGASIVPGESTDHSAGITKSSNQKKVDPQQLLEDHPYREALPSAAASQAAPISQEKTPQILKMDERGNTVSESSHPNEKDPQKALRTYESDVAEVLARRRVSTASIVIAENEREQRQKTPSVEEKPAEQPLAQSHVHVITEATPERTTSAPEASKHSGLKLVILVVSLLFILGGGTVAYYFYSLSPLAPITRTNTLPKQQPQTVIPVDSQSIIAIDSLLPNQIVARVQTEIGQAQAANTIKEIILTRNKNGQPVRLSGPDMVSLLGLQAPDLIKRSLTDPWTLGIYTDAAGNKNIFVVATNNFFQNAFAGMLSWENNMADDLKQYIYAAPIAGIANTIPPAPSILVGSSTPPTSHVQPYFTLRGHFVDGLVKNRDVREFRTDNGNILFLYSFIDGTKLVVAGNEATLAEIITRLEHQGFMR